MRLMMMKLIDFDRRFQVVLQEQEAVDVVSFNIEKLIFLRWKITF